MRLDSLSSTAFNFVVANTLCHPSVSRPSLLRGDSSTVTFVDVSPSTRDRFACCSHPAHLVISFAIVHVHTTFVELVAQVQSTHLVIVAWIQRSFAGMVCMSTTLSVALQETPPVLTESCAAASSWRARFDGLQPHFAQLPPQVWRMLLIGPSCLRDASQVLDRYPFLQVVLAWHSSVCGCQQTTCAAQRCSRLRHPLLCDVDASAMLFISSFYQVLVQPHLRGSPSECIRLVLEDCDQLPHVRHPTAHLGSNVLLSSPNTSTHHYCCTVAHDVLSRSRVETEPTTVQPLHSKFLQRP